MKPGHAYAWGGGAEMPPRPGCTNCGKPAERTRNHWRSVCSACRGNGNRGRRTYRKFKDTNCARCGFVAEHPAQLDIDHIDGNHQNNEPSNLQTLCANCHRLKSVQERVA